MKQIVVSFTGRALNKSSSHSIVEIDMQKRGDDDACRAGARAMRQEIALRKQLKVLLLLEDSVLVVDLLPSPAAS